MPTTPAAVSLRGVTKTFGAVRALDGIDLTIQPGEVVAFLGPNGAAKTTTLDIVLGLARATEGEVEVFGQRPADAVAAGRVTAVQQSGGLLKDLTVAETVRLGAALCKVATPVDGVLARAGIARIGARLAGTPAVTGAIRFRSSLITIPTPPARLTTSRAKAPHTSMPSSLALPDSPTAKAVALPVTATFNGPRANLDRHGNYILSAFMASPN
jgi:ABC-type sugar transport system ATPase subunit